MESKSWKVVTVVKNLSYELFFKCVFFLRGGVLYGFSICKKQKQRCSARLRSGDRLGC